MNSPSQNTSDCPIIFINFGKQAHLVYSTLQAKRVSPKSRVVLLIDEPMSLEGIETVLIRDFSHSSNAFASIYRHHSQNAAWSELICFQRWLIMRDFLHAAKIGRFIYLDSDVLLFCNAARSFERFSMYDFGISLISAHISFFSIEALEAFCAFFESYYKGESPAVSQEISRRISQHTPTETYPMYNISDMLFLELFRKMSSLRNVELYDIFQGPEGPYYYDHNVNAADLGFRMAGGFKEIEWRGGAPFAFHERAQQWVRLKSIHYQGPAKPLMAPHFELTGSGSLAE